MGIQPTKAISTAVLGALLLLGAGPAWALTPTEVAKLTASDAAAVDQFGFSIALAGDTAVVGAPRDADAGIDSGSAYVFIRTGTTWTQQAKLTASDAAAYDQFGRSVALAGDTAVIGAEEDDDAGNTSGSAYVFTRTGTTWTQQAKLTASDAATRDRFGDEVALAGDTAVIGAFGDDPGGSAYVFTRKAGVWDQQAKLTASDAARDDRFGVSVALGSDTAVIGAPRDDDAGTDSGSAYVFTRTGTTWTQQAKLTASDAATRDYFGSGVAVAGDTTVIGAFGNGDAGVNSGSAYVLPIQ